MDKDALLILSIPLLIILVSLIGGIWDYYKKRYLCNMFTQSGINTIELYNAATTTFTRVAENQITNIVGDSVLVDNSMNPTLEQTNKIINRRNYFEYIFNATLFGLDVEASQYRNKFGWLVLITFLDGETRFLNTPVFFQDTELDTNKTHVRVIQFKPNRPTGKTLEVL